MSRKTQAASKKHMTARQKQSQKIAREKAARKMFRSVYQRVVLVMLVVVGLNVLVGGWWFWYSGRLDKAVANIQRGTGVMFAQAGFTLKTIYLEGRNRTPMQQVREAIGVKKGEPILGISVEEMRVRLKQLEHVKEAAVERALPDTLYVRIIEREPVAIWQNKGTLSLVDDEGRVMEGEDISAYNHLPLVVGEEAPRHVSDLLVLLAAEPDLVSRVKAVVRMGDRRWNVKFDHGVQVKLPEEDAQQAWQQLAKMQREQRVLDRDVRTIDMRLKDRIFIKVAPEALRPPKPETPAKET